MQIHELNRKPKVVGEQSVNEVDLVGPTGIFAVGKQVGKELLSKNFKSLYNSPALAAAQQAAAQQSAAASAQKLTNPGAFRRAMGNQAYQVGSGVKPPVTTAQQLQAVNANPAVQQLVKNLSSQWASQSATLKKSQPKTTPVTEAPEIRFNSRELVNNPQYANILKALQAKGIDPAAEIELEKQLSAWKREFSSWADPRLATGGVTIDTVRQDPETAKLLDQALSKVAVAAQSGNANLEKEAAEEYFNIAVAGIQAYIQNTKNAAGSQRATAAGGATANPASTDNDILTQLQTAGIPVTKVSLEKLGQLMAVSSGSNTVRDTGNEVLNAVARLAGMRVTR